MAALSRGKSIGLALFFSATAAAAAPGGGKPALVSGSGETRAGLFTAGAEGAELSVCGAGRLKVAPGGELRVFPVSQRLSLGGGRVATTWTVLSKRGELRVELPESGAPARSRCALLVSAPRKLSMLVLSGTASSVADDDHTTIANFDGEVLASTGAAFRPLAPMHRRTRASDDAGDATPLLAAPGDVRGQRVLISIGEPARVSWIAWSPVDGAASYEVELRARAGAAPLASTRTAEPLLKSALGALEPGVYELAIRAVDERGISGAATTESVRVIGAELPPGAFVDDDGVIRLGKGQRVRFSNVEGLTMTYGNARHYVPASSQVGLYRHAPTTVHFRGESGFHAVRAKLAPRAIRAQVFAGPKLARWPSDPIELRVVLEDDKGRPLPDWIEAHPTVTLGIDPVEVSWHREGRALSATLPPQSTPGPWVVRVEVHDQFGLPLGRDFVEIAKSRPAKVPVQARISAR